MLTGCRLYEGGSPVTIVMKQSGSEPPIPARQLEPSIPPGVEAVLSRLLEKDVAKRFQTADEAIRALDALKQAAASLPPAAASAPPKRTAAMIALPVSGILVVGIVVGLMLGRSGRSPAPAAAPPPAPAAPAPPVVKAPDVRPAEKPAEKPPEKAPEPKAASPREGILARMKDATEKRLTEEVLGRTEELMKAVQAKDPKTIRGFLDEIAFGQLTDAQVLEGFEKAQGVLQTWEIQDVEIRMRVPGARPQPHAQTLMTYDFKFAKGELKATDQPIQWIRKLDGKWYVTKLPKSAK